jgi:2-succinyl-5-enolpyruvyl-6-hydroxy-3-cyclohexene-1-carboxylate synthase
LSGCGSSFLGTVDSTNRNTALASAMTEELARCGVRQAVISPGSRSTPLALALWREPGIEATVIVDERSAGFFALGAAAATRTPVAVLCTSGTAAANLHPAVCEADESAVPLIVLTADRPPELRDIGAGQTIDQLKLYGAAVRWFCEVGTHEADDAGLLHFRSVACRAFAAAAGDCRPGPVHLNVPWRDPLGPEARPDDVTASSQLALEGRSDRPLTAVPAPPQPPAEPLVGALAERIAATPRGLIVAGRMLPGAAEAIAALAATTGFPILAEATSQLRWGPHDRDLVVWGYEALARERPEQLAPELVLRFGDLPTGKPLRQWLGELDDAAQLVVDPTRGWNEPTRKAGAIVRADPALLAAALKGSSLGEPDPAWAETWLACARAAESAIEAELDRVDQPSEPGFWRALGAALGEGELVYTASSMPIRDQEAFLPPGDGDVLFLANRGANGIDGLISSGIGAANASGRPAVIVTGDLGLLHDLGGLAALRDVETPLRIVVLNNDGGGIFEFLPQAEQLDRDEFEGLLGTPRGISVERAAALFDLPYRRVDALGEVGPAFEGTGLIELPVDRAENLALHRRLQDAAMAAVRARLS